MFPLSLRPYLFALAILCFGSCTNEPKVMTTSASDSSENNNPTFNIKNVAKKIGDCEAKENCLKVTLACPLLKGVNKNIQEKINSSIISEVISSMEIERDTILDPSALEVAVEEWSNIFKEYLSEEIGQRAVFTYQMNGSGSIHKNYAVTELPVSTFTGGAHPNHYTYLSNYNLKTGEVIEYEDIIKDPIAFNKILEEAFFEAAEEKDPSVEKDVFFWGKPFYLPANFAIKKKGLEFIYNPYEIAAYAFGTTKFVVPYDELKGVIKLP